MNLHEILAKVSARPIRKRRGRGTGSGLGGTSGRGHKGYKSRSGWRTRYGYEGGQMPIFRRLPKRGFNNYCFRTRYSVVNLADLEAGFQSGDAVDLEALRARLNFKPDTQKLKILGTGALTKKLVVTAHAFSKSARSKIEAAGGACKVIGE